MNKAHLDIHSGIIARCKDGDRSAQHELYQLYAPAMYNSCLRIVKNTEDAKDIIQDAFIDMYMKIGDFREESTFGAWFKRIVINKSLNFIKKARPEILDFESLDIPFEESEYEPVLEYSVSDVKTATKLLPEGYKLVFDLYMFEGLTHHEIAKSLKISEATSKSQLSRAKAKLRSLLNDKPNEN